MARPIGPSASAGSPAGVKNPRQRSGPGTRTDELSGVADHPPEPTDQIVARRVTRIVALAELPGRHLSSLWIGLRRRTDLLILAAALAEPPAHAAARARAVRHAAKSLCPPRPNACVGHRGFASWLSAS
jgi:hypothetical protein